MAVIPDGKRKAGRCRAHLRHEGVHEVGEHERLGQEHAQLPHRHQKHSVRRTRREEDEMR